MGEIISQEMSEELEYLEKEGKVDLNRDVLLITEKLLLESDSNIKEKMTLSVPIVGLSALGAGVSSLIPAFNTVTQTLDMDISGQGLYRLANAGVGDTLQAAKDGTFWGSLKTADGKKFAKWQAVDTVPVSSKTVTAFNPATIMMAVAILSIEKDLDTIVDLAQKIIYYLELEKESEVEADVQTLVNIIKKYKYNWDNKQYLSSNHKMVLDIQRTARKNINIYQKKVSESISTKPFVTAQNIISSSLKKLEKTFKYFRLSVYTYAFASFLEIMLSGNFKEDYISAVRDELRTVAVSYRNIFEDASSYLEHLSNSSLESNILKGVGGAGKAMGKFIGGIPLVKEAPVDKFLRDGGAFLEDNATDIEKKAIKEFSVFSNPKVEVFADKMDVMMQIYNHTAEICFDKDRTYLLEE